MIRKKGFDDVDNDEIFSKQQIPEVMFRCRISFGFSE